MQGLSYFFLLLLIRVSSGTFKVIGLVGHNVTLPCSYDAQTYGVLCICWGQGNVPRSKCSSTILSSQDGAVSFRRSPRYQLQGRVTDGDVSLTILDAQWDDAGMYGCRVEYPGWFNDYKVNTQLIMEEAPVEQPITQNCTLSTVEGKGEQTGELQRLPGSGEHWQGGSYFLLHNHNPRLYFPSDASVQGRWTSAQHLNCWEYL
ncbi:hepatitis A virus cellular receptor 1 homolog isoform X3 [Amphiprion ocellaris]|uniref:hepatitis A virus cellular receptor 1 homolog isoform X3 n=1 Tax=Amphiprion ocellaris TaxID=80972 RepID=UPI001649B5F3|nr:hepatitis A virus cellular receptor 1 homolog isoform X3 [Amphiprion ocellaris]